VSVWVTTSYQTEWEYGIAAHKMIAIDTGHGCQNLYLACETIGPGACAGATAVQGKMDAILAEDESAIYLSPAANVE